MTLVFNSQGYRWTPAEPWVDLARFERILRSWEGTPYISGAMLKQWGSDCARFLCGTLDEFYGLEPAPLEAIPDDTQFHDSDKAMRAVHWMRMRYPSSRVRGIELKPTDIIITGPRTGGPGHGMIVGPRRSTIWHCNRGIGTVETGFSFEHNQQHIKAIYRLRPA